MELHELSVGNVTSFDYPITGQNCATAKPELASRQIVVVHVRDCWEVPIAEQWCQERPNICRGRWLVTGWDLEKQAWRSFYSHSATNVAAIGPGLPPEAIVEVVALWNDGRDRVLQWSTAKQAQSFVSQFNARAPLDRQARMRMVLPGFPRDSLRQVQ